MIGSYRESPARARSSAGPASLARLAPTAAALALALAFAAPPPASAWTYGDTLTVIWKPLPNLPTILRPGDVLTVWANAPSSATGWSASLLLGATTTPLTAAGGGWQPTLGRGRNPGGDLRPLGLLQHVTHRRRASRGQGDSGVQGRLLLRADQ